MVFRTLVAASLAGVGYAQMVVQPLVDVEMLKEELKAGGMNLGAEEGFAPGPLTSPTLCDPTVKQHAGYLTVAPGTNYFFWMFESRGTPSKDPVVLWMTGGPGCSSQLAALSENGPCVVDKDGVNTTPNPHSWNSNANVIWIDQPTGTGFSTGDPTTHDEVGVSTNMYQFMQEFYKALPQYKENDFFIFGESYAGHYVPAVSHYIWEQSKKAGDDFKVPLKGIGIGNGLTNPEEQYKWYPQMAKDGGKAEGGSLETGAITNFIELAAMKAAAWACVGSIHKCNNGDEGSCKTAFAECNLGELAPYQATGLNPYDMRIKCAVRPLCYDFTHVTDFLNSEVVQKQLGVTKKWESCNMVVNAAMQGDYMHNYHMLIPPMLADGMNVLIYAGDVDYICNWLGNKKWTLALDWPHKADFNAAEDAPFMVGGNTSNRIPYKQGRIRSSNGFHFLQMYQAGHMVPLDQPEAALQMLNDFTSGKIAPKATEVIV